MDYNQWLVYIVGIYLLSRCCSVTASVRNPDTPACDCLRAQEQFDILQTIVTRSQLEHLTVISEATKEGCGDLSELPAVISLISCSTWNLDLLWTLQANHETTLSNVVIKCDVNITESIVREVLAARSSGGVERRLQLPVFNFILTQHIDAIATRHLDLAAIHFVSIVRASINHSIDKKSSRGQSCQNESRLMCQASNYEIKHRAGEQAWRVVGRYRNAYQGDPSFLRNKFINFEGMHLKVIHELYTPFNMINNGTYYGFCIDLLEATAGYLNFTYELMDSVDGKFGVKTPAGTWNGMIGMMERQEGDMIVAGLTIDSYRETVVDFTIPFFEEPSAVAVRTKITDEISWSLLFDPLQFYVWVATAGSLVISILLINILEQLGTFKDSTVKGNDAVHVDVDGHLQGLGACAWLMISVYVRQAAVKLPSAGAVRLCLGLIWLVPLIVGWLHGANLTASLATVRRHPPLNTLKELASDTEYTILLSGGSVQRLLFEHATSGIYATLWNKINKTSHTSLTSGSSKALAMMFDDSEGQQKYAVISDYTLLKTKLSRDYGFRCDWAFIPETFYISGYGIALPEGSPYKNIFNRGILAAAASGLTIKFQMRNFLKPSCEEVQHGTQTESKNISLRHVKTMFTLLVAGIALAAIVFLMEHSSKKR